MTRIEKPMPMNALLKKHAAVLSKYVGRKDVIDFVTEANNKYLHWDEFRRRKMPEGADAEVVWLFANLSRQLGMRPFILWRDGPIFRYNITDTISEKLHFFDMKFGGKIESPEVIPSRDKERYLLSSVMEEAIASSRLEGAATTREAAKEMLRSGKKPRTRGEQMVLNNYRTIQRLKELKGRPLSPEILLEIQESMTRDTLDDKKYEGAFRDSDGIVVMDNETGETLYTPPSHKDIPKMVSALCEFANKDQPFIHPIIKAGILHFLVGYIHPFVDGNGRTARAIFYWYLISHDYWSMEYLSISRIITQSPSQYKMAYLFAETDENDLTYFILYQLKVLDKAFQALEKHIQKKIQENAILYDLSKIEEINERQSYILKEFLVNPRRTMTIEEHMTMFGIVYQTARNDLLGLAEKGFVEKRKSGNKFLFFAVKDLEQRIKKAKRE